MTALGATPVVYRVFDAAGFPLYVGSTINLALRLQAHEQTARWWQPGIVVDASTHPTIEAARCAEMHAIRELTPRFNITGRGPRNEWSAADFVEVMYAWDGYLNGRWHGLLRAFRNAHPKIADVVIPEFPVPLPTRFGREQIRTREQARELLPLILADIRRAMPDAA